MKLVPKSSFLIWFFIPVSSMLFAAIMPEASLNMEWIAGFILLSLISYLPLFVLTFINFMYRNDFSFKVTFWTIFTLFISLYLVIIFDSRTDGQSAIALVFIPFLLMPILVMEFFLFKVFIKGKK